VPPGQAEYLYPRETYQPDAITAEWTEEPVRVSWLMVGLIVAALIAVLGLIPLWRTVYRRYAVPPAVPTPVVYLGLCGPGGALNQAIALDPTSPCGDCSAARFSLGPESLCRMHLTAKIPVPHVSGGQNPADGPISHQPYAICHTLSRGTI